ncbi:tail assembly chaperone [Edaphobacillus lindanitolerans]|uniref:Phage tail assembly chaperone protein, TAC n=1 Tax=Edaphobacillus lindanitolerans TaxID=550447 RepID=A0A1U7PTE3_9BACI|nr:tail assembly chaperone [Edaphobacillus lindanitolerans]SIT91719.1 Phage tail assembly chaperone protein, TAC [Edaphobacillus lindanitolerans]
MNFAINGKDYELRFGMLFLKEMDEHYKMKVNGQVEFSMGMKFALPYLKTGNLPALHNTLCAALKHHKEIKPFQVEREIERIAEEDAENETDNLGELFEELLEEMGKQPLLKKEFSQLQKTEKEVAEQGNA